MRRVGKAVLLLLWLWRRRHAARIVRAAAEDPIERRLQRKLLDGLRRLLLVLCRLIGRLRRAGSGATALMMGRPLAANHVARMLRGGRRP